MEQRRQPAAAPARRRRRRPAGLLGLALAVVATCCAIPRPAHAFWAPAPGASTKPVLPRRVPLPVCAAERAGHGGRHGGHHHGHHHHRGGYGAAQQQRQQEPPKPFSPSTTVREINRSINFWGRQRDFGRVQELLAQMEAGGLRPNVYTFNALINAAVSCQRGEHETRLLWQRCVAQHGLRPTAVTYNILLKRYFGNRSPMAQRRALALLDEMRHEGVEPDVMTFNELINICVEGGDMAAATGLLKAMLHRGLKPDATTYTTLIKGYGLKGNLVSAFDCAKEMKAQAVPMTTYSCNVLADACIRCGQPARALRLYRDFESAAADAEAAGHVDEEAGRRQLDAKSFNIMMKAHREMGQLEGALGTLAAMKARGIDPDVVTYNTLVDTYCKAQRPQGARALLGEMQARGFLVSHQTLHPILQEEVTSQALTLDGSLALATELLGAHGLRPTNVTVCTVMEAMLAVERPADAVEAFLRAYTDVGAAPSLVAYNALVKACREVVLSLDPEGQGEMPPLRCLRFHRDGSPPTVIEARTPQEVLQAVLPIADFLSASAAGTTAGTGAGGSGSAGGKGDKAGAGGKGPDSITYNVLMDFAAELGDVPALEAVAAERAAAGFGLDHYVIHSQMKAHAASGHLAGVTEAKERMERLRVPPNERTFSVLVLALLRCGQTAKAELLLRNALSRQLYVHDSLFVAFIQHHMGMGTANANNLSLSHADAGTAATSPAAAAAAAAQPRPRPDLAAARAVFDAFRGARKHHQGHPGGQGGALQRKWALAVWNAWLGALAATGDLAGAEDALEEMQVQGGLRPTRTSYAHVIRAACLAGDTEAAARWLGVLRQRRFSPDIRIYNWLIYACLERPGPARTAQLVEVIHAMEREGVRPNLVTQRAKAQILRVLASRMRTVTDSVVHRLSETLHKAEEQQGKA